MRRNGFAVIEPLERRALLSGGYTFQTVAKIGDPLPNPADGVFTNDFEPGSLNARGQVVFTSEQGKPDKANDLGEAVFLTGPNGRGPIATLNLPNTPAPGGGTFGGFGALGPDTINKRGDAAFIYSLISPTPVPTGVNAAVYRYSHRTGIVEPVVVPGVTHVPGAAPDVTFIGASFHPNLNDHGVLVFPGVVPATIGPGAPFGAGTGLFLQDQHGILSKLLAPGDSIPGVGTFDFAQDPSINGRGDVAFGGHLLGETSIANATPPSLNEWEDVYLRSASGVIRSIAHRGQAAPTRSGGTAGLFNTEFAPYVNDAGQVAFSAIVTNVLLTADPSLQGNFKGDTTGVFLYTGGKVIDVARPGDLMPGGGHVLTTSPFQANSVHLNNRGEVAFVASLDTGQQAVFVWCHGVIDLVAKTGDEVPGGGIITNFDEFGIGVPSAFISNNDRGQVAFNVSLDGGGGALLIATPREADEALAELGDSAHGVDPKVLTPHSPSTITNTTACSRLGTLIDGKISVRVVASPAGESNGSNKGNKDHKDDGDALDRLRNWTPAANQSTRG